MSFNGANCILLPALEAVVAHYLLAECLPNASLTMYWLAFTILNSTVLVFYNMVLRPFFLSPLRKLPQPKGFIPLFGHGRLLLKKRQSGRDWHLQTMKTVPHDGIILRRGFLHSTRLIPTTPAALADVLVHKSYDYEKPSRARRFLMRFLGEGLLLSEGEEHRFQRKRLAPAFHFRNVKELYPVFCAKSMEFCGAIGQELSGRPDGVLNICRYTSRVTLDLICLAGMGRDTGSLWNSEDDLIKNYEEILEPTKEKMAYYTANIVLPPWLVGMLPWKLHERVKVTTGNLRRICSEIVAERKAKMESKDVEGRDILSIMIRDNLLSDNHFADQLLTLLAAGHESTSSALTWASYMLAQHPAIQTRLRCEIQQCTPDSKVLSDSSSDAASLLESMLYLNCVCNEVLRLFPPVSITARVAIRDMVVCGQVIPGSTMLWIAPWAINRNLQLWGPDSEECVPERWIDSKMGRATMNGGAGRERFARAELRGLVGSFDLELENPEEKVVVSGAIASKPRNGMRLKLKNVQWDP
ncbi:cytochrome P450 3A4 [Alternaria rosae]|uniref:cytochrome P450 3A4 n=1 Tax=Alternaria rosae TaxID=1187941 RepID=UPI001E8EBCCD|nr:cytochrome P450 3A4 [Alternaria rosae]KAH6870767.1 cytochrome P450 3A4 [Alternaria rosae]